MIDETARETILLYARSDRNGVLSKEFTDRCERTNPGCGDRVEIRFSLVEDTITRVTFDAQGCALSTASTVMLCETIEGISSANAREIARRFLLLLSETTGEDDDLGELAVFSFLRTNPSRRGCAALPWEALLDALSPEAVSRRKPTSGTDPSDVVSR